MKIENRKFYFDYLRIIATIAVITIHVTTIDWLNLKPDSSTWGLINIFSSSVVWAVPLFTMISGALFLNPNKEIQTKSIYTKNILRIAIAFAFWSVFYAVIHYTSPSDFMYAVLKGHYHLWFCFMISGLYIIVPILRHITKSEKITRYFLIVAFLFSFLLPDIVRELSQQVYSDVLLGLGNSLKSISGNTTITLTAGYTSYFILGHFLSTTDLSKKARIITYILGVYGIVSTIIYTYIFSTYQNVPRSNYLSHFTTNVLFAAIGIFCFAKYELSKIKLGEKMQSVIKTISKCTFGIYLVHPFAISVIEYFGLSSSFINPLLATPIMVTLTFILSLAISAILNNIPFIKKYIV